MVPPPSKPADNFWISEPDVPDQRGKFLCFPDTYVKFHAQTNVKGKLKLPVIPRSSSNSSIRRIGNLDMRILSAIPDSNDDDVPSPSARRPSLFLPPFCDRMDYVPHPIIAKRISERSIRWGSPLVSRGEITYLAGFWDWSIRIHKLLEDKSQADLALAVHGASFDYQRPNSIYRALCEVWCPSTNTFVTSRGEVGISLWDLREITGLSIIGDYYEEVVPSLAELTDGRSYSKCCSYLLKAFAQIANDKEYDRITHSDWLEFWFGQRDFVSNPRSNKDFQKLMRKPKFKGGKLMGRTQRQHIPDTPLPKFDPRGIPQNSLDSLDLSLAELEKERLEIAAYLSLWLCRYVFPCGDSYVRPGTFRAASRMAYGATYSSVPPVLSNIYRGLTQTAFVGEKGELGSVSFAFPGHFFYAWAATYFRRGIFERIDRQFGRPIIRRFGGSFNAFQSWETDSIDGRDLIRGTMSSKDFCWNPIPPPLRYGSREDDGKRSKEVSEFMVSIRPGRLSYRRGSSQVLEWYYPHRFARQQRFRQRLPGSPANSDDRLDLHAHFSYWLSLTQVSSGAKFHILPPCEDMVVQEDESYHKWWVSTALPALDNIPTQLLSSSENGNYELNLPAARYKKHLVKDSSLPTRAIASVVATHSPQRDVVRVLRVKRKAQRSRINLSESTDEDERKVLSSYDGTAKTVGVATRSPVTDISC